MDIKKKFIHKIFMNGHHSSNTPTNHLAIELQHISKKYQILSVFYQKRFKYHILAHMASMNYWHDNYQWQYKQYSVKKLNFYYVNLQIGESLVTVVEIWIFRKIIKTPGMEQNMFIKSKLLAWSAKSRKTPGMECKVQINSWNWVQSLFK